VVEPGGDPCGNLVCFTRFTGILSTFFFAHYVRLNAIGTSQGKIAPWPIN